MPEYPDDIGCKSTCAMLLVSGDNIEADEFTRLFEIVPTDTAKAGVCSGWRISSEGRLASKSAEKHILWILEQIDGRENVIQDLSRRGCQIDVYCSWQAFERRGPSGPLLTAELLRRISGFGLNLIFAFHT